MHTKGPWRVGDNGQTVFGPPNGNPAPQTIAHMAPQDFRANARLIAAAPELLEALRELMAVVIEREQGNHDLDTELDAAEAAIAKATGG